MEYTEHTNELLWDLAGAIRDKEGSIIRHVLLRLKQAGVSSEEALKIAQPRSFFV